MRNSFLLVFIAVLLMGAVVADARVAYVDSTYIKSAGVAGKNIKADAVDSTKVRAGSLAVSDVGGLVFTQYSADPGADSLDVAISGIKSTSRVIALLNTDRADSSIFVHAAVPRTDTLRVYLNMDPAKAVKISILGFK